jgi:hypothetical protein
VFAATGRKTVWLGDAGKGSQLKLVVNAYMSILIEGVARRWSWQIGSASTTGSSPRRSRAPAGRADC